MRFSRVLRVTGTFGLCAILLSGCVPIILGIVYTTDMSIPTVTYAYDGEKRSVEDIAVVLPSQVTINSVNGRAFSSFKVIKSNKILGGWTQIDFLPGMHEIEVCFNVTQSAGTSYSGNKLSENFITYTCKTPTMLQMKMEVGRIYSIEVSREGASSWRVFSKDVTELQKKQVLLSKQKMPG